MPASNSETMARGMFCDGLGSNIMVQHSATLHGRITAREYVDNLGPMIQTLLPNNDAISQDDVPIHTEGELFSHGLKSMKVNFNIFPGQHNHQI
jgi:hypothetical protein